MKSPTSHHHEHSATEPKTTTTAAAAVSEKENDVVSAAISLVTPPRPSSSASGDFQDEGTTKVDFERQVSKHIIFQLLMCKSEQRHQTKRLYRRSEQHLQQRWTMIITKKAHVIIGRWQFSRLSHKNFQRNQRRNYC